MKSRNRQQTINDNKPTLTAIVTTINIPSLRIFTFLSLLQKKHVTEFLCNLNTKNNGFNVYHYFLLLSNELINALVIIFSDKRSDKLKEELEFFYGNSIHYKNTKHSSYVYITPYKTYSSAYNFVTDFAKFCDNTYHLCVNTHDLTLTTHANEQGTEQEWHSLLYKTRQNVVTIKRDLRICESSHTCVYLLFFVCVLKQLNNT